MSTEIKEALDNAGAATDQTQMTPAPEVPASAGEPDPAGAAGEPASGATETDVTASGTGAENLPAAYTPNLKFKVMDKEHEIPAFLKDVIKDEATEKQVREVFEKAYGLDVVKPKFTEMRDKYKQLETTHLGIVEGLQELRGHVQKGDFDSFFDKLKIPHEKVLQWMVEKINYSELPAEQRAAIDARKAAEKRAMMLEKDFSTREQQVMEQLAEAKGYALEAALTRADIKAFADAFDARAGKPGAFRDAVCSYGEGVYRAQQVDVSPDQAIQAVMEHYGKFLGIGQAAPQAHGHATPAAPAPAQPAASARKEPPVIPNVGGRNASPTQSKTVNSLDDLKRIRAEMLAAQSS